MSWMTLALRTGMCSTKITPPERHPWTAKARETWMLCPRRRVDRCRRLSFVHLSGASPAANPGHVRATVRSAESSCDRRGLGIVTSVESSRLALPGIGGASAVRVLGEHVGTGSVGGLDRVVANGRLFIRAVKSGRPDTVVAMACECSSPRCDRRIEVTPREYRPVRASTAQYVVCTRDDHVDQEFDRVVDRQPAYWVIERNASLRGPASTRPREQARVGDDR